MYVCMCVFVQTVDLRKIKAHAELDKQKALKSLKEKLEAEHAQQLTYLMEHQLSNSNQMERGGAEKEVWLFVCTWLHTKTKLIIVFLFRLVQGIAPLIRSNQLLKNKTLVQLSLFQLRHIPHVGEKWRHYKKKSRLT